MTVTFREITRENFKECLRLKVRADQPFVAPNVHSLALSKVAPEFLPFGIYADEVMVGFIMYACFYKQKKLYLCRFMIDAQYQHKGYGKAALDLLKQIAMDDPGIDYMELSTAPDNAYGIRIYEKFGFKDTGVLDEDEEVFVLDLDKKSS
mgnify:CR=1 FL=1